MKVQEAWSKGRSGSGVVVAVVDDGVQLNHPDLRQNIVKCTVIFILTYFLKFILAA